MGLARAGSPGSGILHDMLVGRVLPATDHTGARRRALGRSFFLLRLVFKRNHLTQFGFYLFSLPFFHNHSFPG